MFVAYQVRKYLWFSEFYMIFENLFSRLVVKLMYSYKSFKAFDNTQEIWHTSIIIRFLE